MDRTRFRLSFSIIRETKCLASFTEDQRIAQNGVMIMSKSLISISGRANAQAVTHESEITKLPMSRLWLPVFVFLVALVSSLQMPASTPKIKFPDLSLIVQRLEDVQQQNRAQSHPYEVTRQYKVFRGNDKQPTSVVMTQIDFVPPDIKTYKITQTRGNSTGDKMVREILDRETESAKKGVGSEINRSNYEFLFVGQENFGVVPEHRPEAEGQIPFARPNLGEREHFPHPTN